MTSLESSGLNAGYVEQLLEQYLDNPEAVDPAWREVFERGDGDQLAAVAVAVGAVAFVLGMTVAVLTDSGLY